MKLQAVFILPLYLFVYFAKKKFSLAYFLMIPVANIVFSIPGITQGRGIFECFTIYIDQVEEYKELVKNYPSFWNIWSSIDYASMESMVRPLTLSVTLLMLAAVMLVVLVNKIPLTARNQLFLAFIFSYTCVLFLPVMHERYGYLYEILAIIIAVIYTKTIPLCFSLQFITLVTYGACMFGTTYNTIALSIANTVVYLIYLCILLREMISAKTE
jgi:hypothetical protein